MSEEDYNMLSDSQKEKCILVSNIDLNKDLADKDSVLNTSIDYQNRVFNVIENLLSRQF